MGKVESTKKSGFRSSALDNDIPIPPNFFYEIVDGDKNRHFVNVFKDGVEKNLHENHQPNHDAEDLTSKRRAEISQFLRETLKKPMKYGKFMSTGWIHELVNFLGLFESIKVTPEVVVAWLKSSCFQKLSEEIGNQQDADIITIESEMAENKSCYKGGLKRRATLDVLSSDSDDNLFIPFRRVAKKKQKKPIEVIVLD